MIAVICGLLGGLAIGFLYGVACCVLGVYDSPVIRRWWYEKSRALMIKNGELRQSNERG